MSYSIALHVISGTTQPSNPDDNTLWINSNYDVSKWNIGIDFPLWPIEGEVFIKNRYLSENKCNLVNGTNIITNIGAVYQLQRHVWIRCEAYYFQNGSWKTTIFPSYKNGSYHPNQAWTLGRHRMYYNSANGGGISNVWSGELTEADEYLNIYFNGSAGFMGNHNEFHPVNIINFSGSSAVIIDYESTGSSGSSNAIYFSISAGCNSYANAYTNAILSTRWTATAARSRRTYEFDTSNVFGNYYIIIGNSIGEDKGNSATVKVYGIEYA